MIRTLFSTLIFATMIGSDLAWAQRPNPSTEQRQEMAKHLENMAACLRSSKSIEACHQEMGKACGEKSGEDKCFMMGGMHGCQHGGNSQGAEAKSPKK